MPELYSRMDELNWLTPSIADILEQGAPPPGGDGSIRDHMLTIQRELADMETPAKIINVRSMPSYTLYVAKPETVGRLGSRRTITPQEIRRSLARVAEAHPDWLLGFMPRMQEDEQSIGILLRTNQHRPLSLRRLLVRGNFRTAKHYHAFTLGITLEQELVVSDLERTKHLLIVGSDNAKTHFLRSILLTLILLNTPSELRLILAGKGGENFKALLATPHALGRFVTQADGLEKILEGLTAEVNRRRIVFDEIGATNVDSYNQLAKEANKPSLPRILVLIDSLNDPDWQPSIKVIVAYLERILKEGSPFGIHLMLVTQDLESFEPLRSLITTHAIMRTSAKMLTDQVPDFHPSLLRFIDAFIIEKSTTDQKILPVELSSTTSNELVSAVTYWQQNRQQRQEDSPTNANISGKTGITELLQSPDDIPALMPDKTPEKSSPLTRATAILLDRDTQPIEVASPEIITSENETAHTRPDTLLHQATALSAYLGWVSVGVLTDVLHISPQVAFNLLQQLKQKGIIENSDSPAPRFITPLSG